MNFRNESCYSTTALLQILINYVNKKCVLVDNNSYDKKSNLCGREGMISGIIQYRFLIVSSTRIIPANNA